MRKATGEAAGEAVGEAAREAAGKVAKKTAREAAGEAAPSVRVQLSVYSFRSSGPSIRSARVLFICVPLQFSEGGSGKEGGGGLR